MQITAAKMAGISAAVALAAGAAGGVAGASLAGRNTPAVTSTPQPTVTATAPTLPVEVQAAPEAPAEIVQQIEENVTVNDVDITEARIYTVADIDVVVALVSSVDVDVNAVGIWTMENNVIVGAANAPAAETTDFEQVDPPAEVAEVAAEAEAPAPDPSATEVPVEYIEAIMRENSLSPDVPAYISDPITAGMVEDNGRAYVALAFTYAERSGGHEHYAVVWVIEDGEVHHTGQMSALLTPNVPAADPINKEAVGAALRTVGYDIYHP